MLQDTWRKVKDVPNIQVKFGVILKLHYNAAEDEYRVSPLVKGEFNEKRSYYTDDKEDAIGTMKMMSREEW